MSFANSKEYMSRGLQYVFWGYNDGDGVTGSAGTLANGSDSAAPRLNTKSLDVTIPDIDRTPQTANNGTLATITLQSTDLPTGSLTLADLNADFVAAAIGVKSYDNGEWTSVELLPQDLNPSNLSLIINSPALKTASSGFGTAGWQVRILHNVTLSTSGGAIAERGYVDRPFAIVANRVTKKAYGQPYSTSNDGTVAGGYSEISSPYPVHMHAVRGDGAEHVATLDWTPAAESANAVQVWNATDGTALTYSTDFTVSKSAKTVTLTAAANAAGDLLVIMYQFDPTA